MALDTRYIPIVYLQEYFVGTDGEPLSAGFVSFYQDNSRNIPKQVYKLVSTGSPPAYSYVAIGTQLQLSQQGTFVDPNNGDDIAVYLFPYDGNSSTTTNTLELYYITVQDSSGIPQFVREGVPNLAASGSATGAQSINYALNSQFLLHNSYAPVPGATTFAYGGSIGTVSETSIAPGGWLFERSNGSTAVDTITFTRNTQLITNPNEPGSPRYAVNINRSVGASDAVCQFSLRFMDAFKFNNQDMTLLFTAVLNTGTSLTGVQLNEIQYFGSSTPTVTAKGSPVTITNSITQFAINFTMNNDTLSVVGANDTDFMELALALPPNQTWNVQFSDFILVLGNVTGGGQSLFPITTNGEFVLGALSNLAQTTNPISGAYYPADGSNLYLPVIMTTNGFTYDYSGIGEVEGLFVNSGSQIGNLLYCNGTAYVGSGYSSLGIPYSRLRDVLIANSAVANTPMFGTGATYVTASVIAPTQFLLTINTSGGGDPVATGALTFTGVNPTYTFTVNTVPTSAYYWTFQAYNGSTNIPFYVWYNTGASVDPAPGGTGIMVSVAGGDTTTTIKTKTLAAINAYQFIVPDLRGYFLRGLNGVDPDAPRTLGSIQAQAFLSHTHPAATGAFIESGTGFTQLGSTVNNAQSAATAAAGGNETRPVNFALNWFIRY